VVRGYCLVNDTTPQGLPVLPLVKGKSAASPGHVWYDARTPVTYLFLHCGTALVA